MHILLNMVEIPKKRNLWFSYEEMSTLGSQEKGV